MKNKYLLLPNLLTYLRFAAASSIILPLIFGYRIYSSLVLLIFITGAMSDYLDGYFARKYDLTSNIGAILDPIADKILIASTLLFIMTNTNSKPIYWLSFIIILREVIQFFLRVFLRKNNITLSVIKVGKIKTAFQVVAIILLLINISIGNTYFEYFSIMFILLAAILSVYSFILYAKKTYLAMNKLLSKT
jgi:CDP-diacylglycerol--glycerol-3-phosphate 3-phosphatidyltransferase